MVLRPRHHVLLAAALGLALGACGGSLYDAVGVPKLTATGCDPGTHLCGGGCVADADATACGDACAVCPDPGNGGAPACVAGSGGVFGCGFSCTAPARQCGAQCLAESVDACGATCEVCPNGPPGSTRSCDLVPGGGGTRQCGATCVAPERFCAAANACKLDDFNACGPSCLDCTTGLPAGATATCGAPTVGAPNVCGITCAPGFLPVGGACERPVAIAAGANHTCAITTGGGVGDGGLVCWGSNDRGQLGPNGVGSGGPAVVEIFTSGVSFAAAGSHHTCAIHLGEVTCWGLNASGQLGSGVASVGGPTPVTVGLAGATALAAGATHTCAVAGGAVRCWGANALGQLGTGDTTSHPAPVASLITSGASQLAAFGDTTCAVAGAALRCWGANGAGQTGKGSTSASESTPVTVPLPAAPQLASVGGSHACAILAPVAPSTDTPLYCWGSDLELQLGTRVVPANPLVPVQADKIDSHLQAAVIATGGGHSCAGRAAAGEIALTCSGRSNQGQTGVLNPAPQSEGNVALAHAWVAAAGTDHTCALVDLGAAAGTAGGPYEAQCWGRNAEGQLGRATAGAQDPVPGRVGQ